MPKKAVDYSKTIIYKIVCNDLNITDCYVGHTTEFTKRKYAHKNCCNNEKCRAFSLKVYEVIRNNGGWTNWSMIEVEKYPCRDSNEAYARERHWLESLNASLNIQIPTRTQKQYHEDNKVQLRISQREYYVHNKEHIKDRIKKYTQDNIEHVKNYQKNYRKENYDKTKDELNRKRREKRAANKQEQQSS